MDALGLVLVGALILAALVVAFGDWPGGLLVEEHDDVLDADAVNG